MKRIFISYAKEDKDVAEKLYKDLKALGVDPWLDSENIFAGQNWKSEIKNAIRRCNYFIAIISKRSISKKGYVQKELRLALDELENYPSGEIFIIPVRLDNSEPRNECLESIQRVDLFPSYVDGFAKIKRSIELGLDNHPLRPHSLQDVSGKIRESSISESENRTKKQLVETSFWRNIKILFWKKYITFNRTVSITVLIFVVIIYLSWSDEKTGHERNEQEIFGEAEWSQNSNDIDTNIAKDINVNWGDVKTYFDVNDLDFEKGLKKGTSILKFVIQAKGDFTGEFYYVLKDSQGNEKCLTGVACDSESLKEENYKDQPIWQTKDRKKYAYWRKNEKGIGTIYVPYDTHTVQLNFEQFDLDRELKKRTSF